MTLQFLGRARLFLYLCGDKAEKEPLKLIVCIIGSSAAKCVIADVLLCHDDELEGRRIAFILYLVPPWEKSDGGTLDLFSTDGKGLELSLRGLEKMKLM